jgi:hypothetical protein
MLTLSLAFGSVCADAQPAAIPRWSAATVSMDSDARRHRDHNELVRRLSLLRESPAGPSGFRVVRHDVLVDMPRREAVFNLWLSEVPDFQTVDEFGRQSHSFQYFVDTQDLASFYARGGGSTEPLRPLFIFRGEEIHHDGGVVVREVAPRYEVTDDPASGGWGPAVGTATLRQDKKRVNLRVPLALIGGESGGPSFALHYFLEVYQFGGVVDLTRQAIGKVATVDATIDVGPYGGNRSISSEEHGFLIVHLVTTDSLSAENVDVSTLELGPGHARPQLNLLFDVDRDDSKDLVLAFDTADLGLSCADSDVRLTGEMQNGQGREVFVGFDTIDVRGCQ